VALSKFNQKQVNFGFIAPKPFQNDNSQGCESKHPDKSKSDQINIQSSRNSIFPEPRSTWIALADD